MTGLACRKSSEGRHAVGKIPRRVICATRPMIQSLKSLPFGLARVQLSVGLAGMERQPRRYGMLQAKYELSMKFAAYETLGRGFFSSPWKV
jgi:hypothetical protein